MKLHICFTILCILIISGCDHDEGGAIVGKNLCDFGVIQNGNQLIPFDPETKKVIGFFERWPDGMIQLTTGEGYTPTVNDCLKDKGYGGLLSKIQPYYLPRK